MGCPSAARVGASLVFLAATLSTNLAIAAPPSTGATPACPTSPADVDRWVGNLVQASSPMDYGNRRAWFEACRSQLAPSGLSGGNAYVQSQISQCVAPFDDLSASVAGLNPAPGNSIGLIGITGPSGADRAYTDPRRVIHNVPGVQDVAAPLKDPAFLNVVGNPAVSPTGPQMQAAVDRMIAAMRTARNPQDPSIPAVDPSRPIRVFEYTSQNLRSVGTPNGFGRLFIQIPGPYFDQWIQLSRDTSSPPASTAPGNAFSIVTMVHHARNGRSPAAIEPPEVYFNDLWRNSDSSGHLTRVDHRLNHERMENCAVCHKTGLNAIYPRPGTPVTILSHEDARGRPVPSRSAGRETRDPDTVITNLNSDITRFSTNMSMPGFAGNGQNWGPSLGSETMSDAFIQQCANLPAGSPDIALLRGKVSCAACHDGTMAAPINFPSGILGRTIPPVNGTGTQDITHAAIMNGRMPPPSGVPARLRESLFGCLREQYYAGYAGITAPGPGTLRRFLRPQACDQLRLVQTTGSGSFCLNASGAGIPNPPIPTGATPLPPCPTSGIAGSSSPPPPPSTGTSSGAPAAGVADPFSAMDAGLPPPPH